MATRISTNNGDFVKFPFRDYVYETGKITVYIYQCENVDGEWEEEFEPIQH